MESTEFPVGRLLNGDSYKTPTRIKNISSAMNWIQKQMESLRESDKQLLSLFNKLEGDMVDLKTLCMEGSRGRTASVSSIGIIPENSTASNTRPIEGFNFHTTGPRILEESMNEYQLERTSSNDSLENFADLLGEDDLEETAPRMSLKSQGSNFSSEFNSNLSLHDQDRISGGGDVRGALDDAFSMTSQSSGSSTRLNVTNSSPHLSRTGSAKKNYSHYSSNDSGALVDPEQSNHSNNTTITLNTTNTNPTTARENNTSSPFFGSTTVHGDNLTTTLTDAENAKRMSGVGLAGEIFALLNMK